LGGAAKLPWNLEWAAKWGLLGVTIEGCGKDLATAGGSRDRSDAISREVFDVEPPRNVTYEFLNVGGRKMSTSKGQGVAAHAIAELLPPEQLRFLFLRPRPNQVIDFDPEGETIPRLFDEFDRIAAATAGREVKGELPADHERLFAYSLLGPTPDVAAAAAAFRPAFAHLALLLQIPGVDIAERMQAEKGGPLTEFEVGVLAERTAAARAWLDSYAPERARLVIQREAVPAEVGALDEAQRGYLVSLATAAAAEKPGSGDAWQSLIFRVASESALAPGRAFGAIYAAFLGRTNGPRAGWLLTSLEPAFVVERLRAAAG
jgi:lysyl-tRNA synthetase class 1